MPRRTTHSRFELFPECDRLAIEPLALPILATIQRRQPFHACALGIEPPVADGLLPTRHRGGILCILKFEARHEFAALPE